MNYAYKRVSTEKQDLRRQEEAFKGINIDREFCDKFSGSKVDRPQLNKLRLEVPIPAHPTRSSGYIRPVNPV
jgi:DNA invertase Pin-like site-specific DNA recombinase